ncbi:MAG: polysaccharide deacetylase family protein [Candidatus Aminicenantes bacterium]|nr:polysaccharide deacetylase family protein [Candidatus Aminicenantes bacterium]
MREPVRNAIVITFDDGFLDNWIWAYPLLKKYGFKATIFVSSEFVDLKNGVRPNLDDHEQGRTSLEEITRWGYLSWEEMKLMEASGLIDIQAHTMTHTKYFVSDKLVDFHHPGADILYPVGNLFPERKPYSISDVSFEKLLPYGFPLFEERSSVIAKKVTINPKFSDECVDILKNYNFENYAFEDAIEIVSPLYESYKEKGNLIIRRESEEEYLKRIEYEIVGAKKTVEDKLQKKVEFLCWPHGDNDEFVHELALKAGYLLTTKGKANVHKNNASTRIPERMGMNYTSLQKKLKSQFKLKAFADKFPYNLFLHAFRSVK